MLAACGIVVVVEEIKGVLRRRSVDLFGQGADVPAGGSAVFRRALRTDGIERGHALFIGHRVAHAPAAGTTHIVHADRRHGFDAMVDLRGTHRITSAAANTDHADPVRVHSRMIRKEIDRRTEILHADFGRLDPARIAAAFAVIGSVERQRNIPRLRQATGVKPRGLLLYATERMADNQCRVSLRGVIARRKKKVADHVDQKAVPECNLLPPHSVPCFGDRRPGIGGQAFTLQHLVQHQASGICFTAFTLNYNI